MRYLQPDCAFTDHTFVPNICVGIDDDGCIAHWGPAPSGVKIDKLSNRALMPGFVNSHSHVFQRMLRGRAEAQSTSAADNFWTWRHKMYQLVDSLNPDDIEVISKYAFTEMLLAGYTSVKEFHYLHHSPGGTPYRDVHEMAVRIETAAEQVGMALHLLRVAYPNTSEDSQLRFADKNIDVAIERTESLAQRLSCPVGIAPHSIRAVDPNGFVQCAQWAIQQGAECHAHVSEQPREITWALDTYGARPMQLLANHGVLSPTFTAVHATHLDENEVNAAGAAGITACLCPTTEANLGDGFALTGELIAAGTKLAIGSDSQAEIDPFLECRLLEYNERNRKNARGVLSPGNLLAETTERTTLGSKLRLLELNLDHPSLVGVPSTELADAVVMAGRPSMIDALWLGTQRVRPVLDSSDYIAAIGRLL